MAIAEPVHHRRYGKQITPRRMMAEIGNDEVIPEAVHLHERQTSGQRSHEDLVRKAASACWPSQEQSVEAQQPVQSVEAQPLGQSQEQSVEAQPLGQSQEQSVAAQPLGQPQESQAWSL
jgi:hypothetical protein